jgi:hypothetical protein
MHRDIVFFHGRDHEGVWRFYVESARVAKESIFSVVFEESFGHGRSQGIVGAAKEDGMYGRGIGHGKGRGFEDVVLARL